jgi:hypothetical protein
LMKMHWSMLIFKCWLYFLFVTFTHLGFCHENIFQINWTWQYLKVQA